MGAYSNVGARTRRINSSGNQNVASHSALRNCLFADVPIETIPAVRTSPIQCSKSPRPTRPTQPYLISLVVSITRFHSRSRSTFCRRSHSSARAAPSTGVAARRRYQAPPLAVRNGGTWPLNADVDHGEEGEDLACRGHGGFACACRRWRSSSTASALTSPAGHQVSH
jgi:hypothetical protein